MEALGLDVKLLIAQLVNFAIFYIIFRKFVAKPLLAYIEKQKKDENHRQSLSSELENAHKTMEEDRVQLMKDLKKKQKEMLDESKKYAEEVRVDLLAKAKMQSDELVSSGKEAIQEERRLAEKELTAYVQRMAEKVLLNSLEKEMDPTLRKTLTEKIIHSAKQS